MFNVLDRLKKLKHSEPDKFDRICDRLDEIRGSAGSAFGSMADGATTEDYIYLASIRKQTDDFFSRLATIDRANEEFWRHIGSRWVGRTEVDDLPQPDTRDTAQKQQEEALIRTIVLSHHPSHTLKLMLEFNHPQRILNKLLLNHDRKNLLYGIRTKFGLPLATYLTPKQNFQARGSLIDDDLGVTKYSRQSFQDGRLTPDYSEDPRDTASPESGRSEDILVGDDPNYDKLQELLDGSVLYAPRQFLRRRKPKFVPRVKTSMVELSGEDTDSELDPVAAILSRSATASPATESSQDVEELPAKETSGTVTFEEALLAQDEENLLNPADISMTTIGSSSADSDEGETPKPADEGAGGMDQYRLQRLKIIFEESDTDDEPGLDINEFKQAMKKILGEDVPEREIELIFMKVDANCDGNVDWNEFLEFTLREFQERDAMTQLTKDAFFDKAPVNIHGTKSQREIRALIFVRQQSFRRAALDLTNGRYYTLNSEGHVICWSTDFKMIASFDLIPDARGSNIYIQANDMCAMQEIKAIVVSFTSGDVHFYNYDDVKLDLFFSITGLKSPVLCLYYYFQETESILLMGYQSGKVGVIRFKSLHYDGLWGSLGLPHSNNPLVTWSFLVKKGKAYNAKGMLGSDWINQVKFFPTLNAMMACSLDPHASLCVIPFHNQREPIYFSQKDGFNCFDYNDFLNVIVTGSKNRSIQVWNQDNIESPSGHFDGHEGAINKVTCFRDAEYTVLISVDAHHVVKVWDFKDQACLQSYDSKGHMLPHHATTFMYYNPMVEHLVYGARDVALLKRVSRHRKGPIQLFQKTHEEPVVGALYNTLFECVVTACQASTIMVWNFQTGDKIIQYRNAHTVTVNGKVVQVPIKSMSFDANQRRLITCGSDGLIKLWNFNNGACLSFFDQLEGVDLNVVRYQKNRDLVVAAGWNQYIFMVRDTRGEDDVDETVYEWPKTHRADITAFEIVYAPEDNKFELEDPTPPEDVREPDIEADPNSSYIAVQIKRKSIEDLRDAEAGDVPATSDSVELGTSTSVEAEAKSEVELRGQIDSEQTTSESYIKPGNIKPEKELNESKSETAVKSFESEGGFNEAGETRSENDGKASSDSAAGTGSGSEAGNGDGEGDGSGDGSGEGDEEDDDEDDGADELAKLADDDSYIISGSSDGELIVWHLFSGTPVCFLNTDGCPLALSQKARADYAARTVNDIPKLEIKDSGSIEHFLGLQMVQHQKGANLRGFFSPTKDDPITVPKVPQQSRNCITCILVLHNRVFSDGNTASVITASTDGFVRAWSIHYSTGGLLGLFYAAHEFDSFITTMYTDDKNELLFTGDTRGYIKVWLLCEWMQASEHLKGHRHCFDPRNFPFIKRHRIFASLLASRANYMMRKAVDRLDKSQRGLYRQPYILNSFRGHLQRVTQIQVVFHKKIIITASEDCAVRLWHFSGLYIGTLGQDLAFHNDAAVVTAAKESSTSKSSDADATDGTKDEKTSGLDPDGEEEDSEESLLPDDDTFLHEDEDPNEVLKPKVIIPVDLAEKGSQAALQVLYSDRHKRTEIPAYIEDAEDGKLTAEAKDASGIWVNSREDYIEAIQELTVVQNHFEEYQPKPFRFFGYEPPYEVKDAEALVFTHTPLHEMEAIGTLYTVVPKNLYDYNLCKTQNSLLERLPAELRVPFLKLQSTGQLIGPALEVLKNLVKEREEGLVPVKPGKDAKTRTERTKETSGPSKSTHVSTKSLGEELASISQQLKFPDGRAKSPHAHPGTKGDGLRKVVHHALLSSKKPAESDAAVERRQSAKSRAPSTSELLDDVSSEFSQSDLRSSRRPSPFGGRPLSSHGSSFPLNDDFINADRIDIATLQGSEEEFSEDIILEQERTAKFEYLALLERGGTRPSQTELYLPLLKNDAELYTEIRPMLEPGVKLDISAKPLVVKRVRLKTVKSVSSMDRIQRVFKMPDYERKGSLKEERTRELQLTVPPLPRRLASVIKGQVRNGKRAASFYNFDDLDEPESPLGGKKLWGDQESLAIFDQKMRRRSVPVVAPSLPKLKKKPSTKGKRKKTDLKDALALQPVTRTLQKQRPFTNRYIYRQLSDSVLHEPGPTETNQQNSLVDVTRFLTERRVIRDQELAQREARRLNEELYQTQRKSVGFSKARSLATGKALNKATNRLQPNASLRDLNKMLDKVKIVEEEFLTPQKRS